MTLEPLNIPASVANREHTAVAAELMALAHQRIDSYLDSSEPTIHNFVPCDFELVDQTLGWLTQNHLLTGPNFCELGSGFGVTTLLASLHGMNAVGIEREPTLVTQANTLAVHFFPDSPFYCGSFIPRGIDDILELASEVEHVSTEEDDIYEEIGIASEEFDLFFAFPWPGEAHFFESVFQSIASNGACLLTYEGREGMKLVRKLDS